MITSKNFVSKVLAAVAIVMSPLLLTVPARAENNGQVEIKFTKWITTFPLMAGVVGGDVPGVFEGTVFQSTLMPGGQFTRIEARYDIIANDPRHSFSALLHGKANNQTTQRVLNGVITDGWHAGAQVHVEFKPGPCMQGTCFDGTILILPGQRQVTPN
jgi:hypothetical protein